MNTIDKILLLKHMKNEIGRDYGDGIQVLTHGFEIQDNSRLTAVIKIDISLNDKTGVVEVVEQLMGEGKMRLAITNTIIEKLKIYIEDEIHRTREKVKEALNYD